MTATAPRLYTMEETAARLHKNRREGQLEKRDSSLVE